MAHFGLGWDKPLLRTRLGLGGPQRLQQRLPAA